MKLPITEQFLWSLYEAAEKVGDALSSATPPMGIKEASAPYLSALKRRYERKYQNKKRRKSFQKFIYYLKKKGYIRIKSLEESQAVLLTQKGREKAIKAKFRKAGQEKSKRKDGKCIMVFFDIPEKKRRKRDLLREHLQFLGYEMLQRSVWICPYDVLEETKMLIREYGLDSYVNLFLIKEQDI